MKCSCISTAAVAEHTSFVATVMKTISIHGLHWKMSSSVYTGKCQALFPSQDKILSSTSHAGKILYKCTQCDILRHCFDAAHPLGWMASEH